VTSIFIGVVYERESAAAESESHPMREERTEHAVWRLSDQCDGDRRIRERPTNCGDYSEHRANYRQRLITNAGRIYERRQPAIRTCERRSLSRCRHGPRGASGDGQEQR